MDLTRTSSLEIVCFETLTELFVNDDGFKKVYATCMLKQHCDIFIYMMGFS